MQPLGVRTSHSGRFLAAICLAAALAVPALASAQITVHSPGEVLSRWTTASGDRLVFQSPEGDQWELVTDVRDPVIRNAGAGEFFPVNAEWVASALAAITFDGTLHRADIFILPYPRRDVLDSNAGESTIYLSPSVAPLDEPRVHALVAHEVGHLVHNAFLPDYDIEGWSAYRALRGIENTDIYSANAEHKNRPHEIFAEDFRALYGGEKANYSGSIENQEIAAPEEVPALRDFFRSLVDSDRLAGLLPRRPLSVFPNPSPGPVRFARTGPSVGDANLYRLEVFDVQGRRVAREDLVSATNLGWNGLTSGGERVPAGLYFVRLRGEGQTWVGKVLIRRN